MNDTRDQRTEEPRDSKLPYTRPELITHGKVEDVTEQSNGGISYPLPP